MTGDGAEPKRGYDESRNYPLEHYRGFTLLPARIDLLLASLVGGPLAVVIGIGIADTDWGKDDGVMQVLGVGLAVLGAAWTIVAMLKLAVGRRNRARLWDRP